MLTGVGRSELVQTNSCDNGEYFSGDVAGDVGVGGREGGRALWRAGAAGLWGQVSRGCGGGVGALRTEQLTAGFRAQRTFRDEDRC